jgi:hypothetical protein
MRARGFSSSVISSVSRSALVVGAPLSWSSGRLEVTEISVVPSLVWLRRRAVLAAVSFSKVTVALFVSPSVVTSMEVILPLGGVSG